MAAEGYDVFKRREKRVGCGSPGDSVVKNPPANAGDPGSILDLVRFHMLQSN